MGQDNAELIAEARRWNDKIGNPFDRMQLTDVDLRSAVFAIERALEALERVTPREVTTVAELNNLPDGAVIRWDNGADFVTAERYYRIWMPAGTDGTLDSADITLPATVLFTPTGKETE